jgi:hypothetical protein
MGAMEGGVGHRFAVLAVGVFVLLASAAVAHVCGRLSGICCIWQMSLSGLSLVDEADWRISVTVSGSGAADALYDHLARQGSVESAGGSLSRPVGETVFAYGSTQPCIERIARDIRSTLDSLQLEPTAVVIDRWVPDEGRWSGDRENRTGSTGSNWLDVIATGLLNGSPW